MDHNRIPRYNITDAERNLTRNRIELEPEQTRNDIADIDAAVLRIQERRQRESEDRENTGDAPSGPSRTFGSSRQTGFIRRHSGGKKRKSKRKSAGKRKSVTKRKSTGKRKRKSVTIRRKKK